MGEPVKKDFPKLHSLDRISKIPVVETSFQYATVMYWRIKNSNSLVRWSLKSVEGGIQKAVEKSLIAVPLLETPLVIVDTIVCKSLDTVEQRVPYINYPPELLLNMTKDLVTARIVQPAVKRVDSVKQFSVNEVARYTEIAASRLDTALDVADKYVDKYLPDTADGECKVVENSSKDHKTSHTIEHVNCFSRKLQRRLTKRTIAEAKALGKGGVDTAQFLVYLLEMLIKDPKQFMGKMKAVWNHLSEDEPENQKPPENLEQLIAMITREFARRIVHVTNFTAKTASNLPAITAEAAHYTHHQALLLIDHVAKTVHLEGAKAIAIARARMEVENANVRVKQLLELLRQLLDTLGSTINKTEPQAIPIEPLPAADGKTQNSNNVQKKSKKQKDVNNCNHKSSKPDPKQNEPSETNHVADKNSNSE